MLKRITSIIIALMFLLVPIKTVSAQEETGYPVYIVQSGENLTEIAEKFGISVQDLIDANNITDSNLISAGTQLIIPGIEGISGVLTTTPVEFGETLPSILRRYRISSDNFQKLNSITNPSEIYVGSNLILPKSEDQLQFNNSIVLQHEDSTLAAALANNLNPWYLAKANQIDPIQSLPGDVFFFYSAGGKGFYTAFSDRISEIDVTPLPVVQGHTSEIRVVTGDSLTLTGAFAGYSLNFFPDGTNQYYYALQGIHALAEPGLIPLRISGQFADGQSFSVEQMVLMKSGNYNNEALSVDQATIDVAITEAESKNIAEILKPISSEKLWSGSFRYPVDGSIDDNTMGFSSYYGNRRSYNGGEYYGFHGGLDFLVVVNSLNAYAPAPGVVAYTGMMDVRGNTIFIDHGQGIYTGYAHLNEIVVNAGDRVETGQVIGIIGKTGRVTGPHLHWDVWVNGVAVDPFDWVDNIYP
jgi:murein DD-endopeptidase MepM/ murein hydrolase activator NlpD